MELSLRSGGTEIDSPTFHIPHKIYCRPVLDRHGVTRGGSEHHHYTTPTASPHRDGSRPTPCTRPARGTAEWREPSRVNPHCIAKQAPNACIRLTPHSLCVTGPLAVLCRTGRPRSPGAARRDLGTLIASIAPTRGLTRARAPCTENGAFGPVIRHARRVMQSNWLGYHSPGASSVGSL